MYSSSVLATVAAVFASTSLAAPATQLFNLTVTSLNSGKYSNAKVGAYHAGAGEEALAVGDLFDSFSFAATNGESPKGFSPPGFLQYLQPAEPQPVLQTLYSVQNDSSNVQALFFGEGTAPVQITFTDSGALYHSGGAQEADSYFYVCPISQLGYNYNVISYVAEGTKPDNEGCDQVTIQKVAQ